MSIQESYILPPGFSAAGIHAGIKKDADLKDMALILADTPSTAAGVFTRNQVKAAPVKLDMETIRSGKGQAIIVNSGNANACTGQRGLDDARAMAAASFTPSPTIATTRPCD